MPILLNIQSHNYIILLMYAIGHDGNLENHHLVIQHVGACVVLFGRLWLFFMAGCFWINGVIRLVVRLKLDNDCLSFHSVLQYFLHQCILGFHWLIALVGFRYKLIHYKPEFNLVRNIQLFRHSCFPELV